MAGASQFMAGQPRSGTRASSSVPMGGNTTDDRKIPACTAAAMILAGLVLYGLDKAKFKMVVGVS